MANQANYTTYSGHSSTTVNVSTQAELDAAVQSLISGSGGTILLDGAGGPYDVHIGDYNGPTGGAGSELLITSADPNAQSVINEIALIDTGYVTFDNVHIDSSNGHVPTHGYDMFVSGSNHIEFTNSTMTGSANGYVSESGSATIGNNLGLFTHSSDMLFGGNTVTDYFHGVVSLEMQNLTIQGNEITAIQGDGLRFGGVQDVQILDNYMHDFYGSTQTINHSDMIQFWGSGATLLTQNVEIAGNLLDSGFGAATQSIFMRNELFGTNQTSGGYYQNISIHDNVIHNGHWHGISVSDASGVDISDNTVLWNSNSGMQTTDGGAVQSGQPWIMASNTQNTMIDANISWRVDVAGDWQWGNNNPNNYILDYNDGSAANYVDNHIIDLWGYQGPDSLKIDPNSPLYNQMGAALSSDGTYVVTGVSGSTTTTTSISTLDTSGTTTDEGGADTTDTGATTTVTTSPTLVLDTTATETEEDAAPEDEGGGNILTQFFEALVGIVRAIFSGGKPKKDTTEDDDTADKTTGKPKARSEDSTSGDAEVVLLSDLMPSTGSMDDSSGSGAADETEELDLAV